MPTFSLKLTFKPRAEVNEILEKARFMEQEVVRWMIKKKKTALSTAQKVFYYPFRERHKELHSQWVTSALKTATSIVHQFNKRKRKGKAKRPKLKKPFLSLSPHLFKVSWDGFGLKVMVSKSANDLEPIAFWFKPKKKYKEVLDKWLTGEYEIGQITLTPCSITIPFKAKSVPTYHPFSVIGVDSNEHSLDYFNPLTGEMNKFDTSKISRINRDYDRRIQRATKGKNNPKAKRKIQKRYGRLRKERTRDLWCSTALWFVYLALQNQAGLVLERLSGMKSKIPFRFASRRMRQRLLNHWSIMTFHRILEMKARQYGVPIAFINPSGTSRTCPICGESLRGQDKDCPSCKLSRHYAAAINIAYRGLKKFPSVVLLGQGSVGDPGCPSSGSAVCGQAGSYHEGNYAVAKATA